MASAKSVFLRLYQQHRFLRTSATVNVLHTQSSCRNACTSSTNSSSQKTLRKLNPTGPENHQSAAAVSFFKSYGFSDAHIAKLAAKDPVLFKANVGETLKPKLDCLVDNGMSGSFLHVLIVADPGILRKSLEDHLQPTLSLLRTCLGSNKNVARAVKRSSCLLSRGNGLTMKDNLNFLVSEGVPMKSISKLISKQILIRYQVDRMVQAVKSAKQFGFCPDDPMFVYAIQSILFNAESTMYKKAELLKNLLGLSEEEVKSVFRRFPRSFCFSEEKMKNVINFFVNTMQAEPSILLRNPDFFSRSVDKILVPRYNVFKVLETKKLLKEGRKFTGTIKKSEKWFESNFVVKYLDQVPELMEIYHGSLKTSNTAAANENNESVVLSLLKSYGFSDAQVAKLVVKDPRILKSNVDETLKSKLDCLADFGVSGSFLHELIVADPAILRRSLDDHLQPTLSLLRTCLGSNENVVRAVKRYSYLLSRGNGPTMEDNLNYLVSEGVPMNIISRLIHIKPSIITQQVDRMVRAVKSAKQFGFRPDDPMLVHAIQSIHSLNESTLYKKTEMLKNLLGLSEEEVKSMFRRSPRSFCCSEEKMKNVVNFFVNTMQAEPSILLDNPVFFSYSVDNTLVPRYNVFKILATKKLLKEDRKFIGTIKRSEKWFETNCVVKYLDDVPNLMEIYHGSFKTSNTQSVIHTTTSEVPE